MNATVQLGSCTCKNGHSWASPVQAVDGGVTVAISRCPTCAEMFEKATEPAGPTVPPPTIEERRRHFDDNTRYLENLRRSHVLDAKERADIEKMLLARKRP